MGWLDKSLLIVVMICASWVFHAAAMAHGTTPDPTPAMMPVHLTLSAGAEQELSALPEDCQEQSEHDPGSLHDYPCCFSICLESAWVVDGELRPLPQRNSRFTIVNYKWRSGMPSPPRRPPRRLI